MYSITKNHILDLLKIGACLNHGKVFPHHFQTITLEDNYSWELGCCFWGSLKGWFCSCHKASWHIKKAVGTYHQLVWGPLTLHVGLSEFRVPCSLKHIIYQYIPIKMTIGWGYPRVIKRGNGSIYKYYLYIDNFSSYKPPQVINHFPASHVWIPEGTKTTKHMLQLFQFQTDPLVHLPRQNSNLFSAEKSQVQSLARRQHLARQDNPGTFWESSPKLDDGNKDHQAS